MYAVVNDVGGDEKRNAVEKSGRQPGTGGNEHLAVGKEVCKGTDAELEKGRKNGGKELQQTVAKQADGVLFREDFSAADVGKHAAEKPDGGKQREHLAGIQEEKRDLRDQIHSVFAIGSYHNAVRHAYDRAAQAGGWFFQGTDGRFKRAFAGLKAKPLPSCQAEKKAEDHEEHEQIASKFGHPGSGDGKALVDKPVQDSHKITSWIFYQNNIGIGSAHKFWTGLPTSEISKQGPGFYVLAVQDAGWEHVKKFDIGFDMMLFNQLNITFDYFHDKRERILMSRASWPSMLGYWGSKPWSNIGEVENQGFELSLNWTKQFGKDLTLDLRGNFTYNQNEYKYVDEPSYPYVWQTNTGKPLNTVKGYIAEGLFASEEEIANSPDQSQLGANIMPGDIKYRDINGDGQITTEDQVMISSYDWHPRIQYGFGLNIVYKNFDLGVFFNGSAKRKIMINSGIAPFLSGGGDGEEAETLARNLMQWIADDHWSVDNPNPNAAYPRLGLTKADVTNNVRPSTFWLRNGNFLRFKTLEIGYRLPYCRIYLSGDNLAVFSPFKLWDPELAWNAYPLSRTFNLGVQFTF